MPASAPAARLMIGASESAADLLYATRFLAPDPFFWIEHQGRTLAGFTALEVDRARATASVDRVLSIARLHQTLRQQLGRSPSFAEIALVHLRKLRIRHVQVPGWTDAASLRTLESNRLRVTVIQGPFFPERETKSPEEIRAITQALRAAEIGLARAFDILRQATIRPRRPLLWNGRTLTSEILRGEIDAAVIRAGAVPSGTIVAGGAQACDPHERGSGPLRPHQTIILDIFPRSLRTGYFGDLTRTVVKGRASESLRHLWHTVAEGKRWALSQIRPGASGQTIHDALLHRFKQAGYPTVKKAGRWTGFFHGTGHGLGLEIHETPRFSDTRFPPGLAITVEPGLYDPALGGVRLEDLVIVTPRGCRNLTRAPEFIEIP
ncbi:MAG: Xaa-Pro peptidase family protein [Verrucomicrobiia bacterium]